MRITTSMLSANYLASLNKNLSKIGRYQEQLATSRRIIRPSDDPVGVISSLAVRSKLNNLEQYNRNIEDARSWLTQSETAVMDINEVVKSAYELSLQAAGGTLSASEKKDIATAIGQLREHVLQTGNTSLGNRYIFGGFSTSTPPFTAAGSAVLYQGSDLRTASPVEIAELKNQPIEISIGTGLKTAMGLTGVDLMGTGTANLIGILDDLQQALRNNAGSTDMAGFAGRLLRKQEDILTLAADIGGRTNRLDLVANRYAQDELNYETLKSSVEEIDPAEVIMKLKMAESIYEAALSIGSRVILPALTDFLK